MRGTTKESKKTLVGSKRLCGKAAVATTDKKKQSEMKCRRTIRDESIKYGDIVVDSSDSAEDDPAPV